MLFVFEEDDKHGIWMKDMLFPLDVIWMDKEGNVVDYVENLQPCLNLANCKTYFPKKEARYVLEINAGVAKSLLK